MFGFVLMIALSRKEQQVWNFISDTQQRLGLAPSLREIQKHCDFGSTRSAFDYVKVLAKKGYLKRAPRTARALRIIDPAAPPPRNSLSIPVYGSIPAGPPEERTQTPEDYITMDLGTLGIPKPSSRIFALRVKGDSMEGAGILDGDWAILDHSKEPRAGSIVAAYIDGKSTLKRFLVRQGKPYLKAENPRYPDLIPCEELMVQGVFIGLYRRG
jgi:repressor LexA